MTEHTTPYLSKELLKRIKLIRRDFGNLLFHFTRRPSEPYIKVKTGNGISRQITARTASDVLSEILYDGKLKGTSTWSYGQNCICFSESPIQELASLFSLVEIAASEKERPRYEPYGIAVSKKWFFGKGGRQVIYGRPDEFKYIHEDQKYRFVPYDPLHGMDFTWEREWRIKADELVLDPKQTLVIVPTAEEAFALVYEFANIEPDGYDDDGNPEGLFHNPKWLAVALEIFGASPG